MYRLLIVDDEPWIADGLFDEFRNISAMELDVYKAYSGRAALELLAKTRMDVVVTDIRMPGIDGIQLLKKIHFNWPECKVIFLTGYREFDYAYSALQHKGVRYILKTEGFDSVIRAVESAVKEIEDSLKTQNLIEEANRQINTASLLLQKEYLTSLLHNEEILRKSDQSLLDRLGMDLKADSHILMLMGRIDHLPKKISYTEKTKLFYTLQLITGQYLSPRVHYVQLTDEYQDLLWLIQPAELFQPVEAGTGLPEDRWGPIVLFVKGTLEMIQNVCRETLQLSVSFALDTETAQWKDIAEKYQSLRLLMNYRIGSGNEMLLTEKNLEWDESAVVIRDKNLLVSLKPNMLEALEIALERGEREELGKLLENITAGMEKIASMHYTPAMEIYYSLSLLLMSHINRWKLNEKVPFKIGLHKLLRADEHESWEEAVGYLKQLSDIIFDIQAGEQEKRADNTIVLIKEYINNHLQEDLSLVKLSDLVYFNPNYLSHLFKQQAGINLSEYIQETRIKKAKFLLARPEMKVNDIASAVGYGSATNFIRFFKKITGMTPLEYRESINIYKSE
jgi:two-component system, response regulator YesN